MNSAVLRPGLRTFGGSESRPGDRMIVGAGLKMYLNYEETRRWLRALRARESELRGVGVFVLPTFPAIGEAKAALSGSAILYGAQDTCWEERGPYTGEVSPTVLRELGCTIVEIGHAERRSMFGDDDDRVGRKTAAALRRGLVPLVCVGDRTRKSEKLTIAEVTDQVRAALAPAVREAVAVNDGSFTDAVIIAYEPVWAIGGEIGAPASYAAPVVEAIRRTLAGLWQGESAVLYGGSVNAENAKELLACGADGLFVGHAALNPDEFVKIAKTVSDHHPV